jgi:hypothetical protein
MLARTERFPQTGQRERGSVVCRWHGGVESPVVLFGQPPSTVRVSEDPVGELAVDRGLLLLRRQGGLDVAAAALDLRQPDVDRGVVHACFEQRHRVAAVSSPGGGHSRGVPPPTRDIDDPLPELGLVTDVHVGRVGAEHLGDEVAVVVGGDPGDPGLDADLVGLQVRRLDSFQLSHVRLPAFAVRTVGVLAGEL